MVIFKEEHKLAYGEKWQAVADFQLANLFSNIQSMLEAKKSLAEIQQYIRSEKGLADLPAGKAEQSLYEKIIIAAFPPDPEKFTNDLDMETQVKEAIATEIKNHLQIAIKTVGFFKLVKEAIAIKIQDIEGRNCQLTTINDKLTTAKNKLSTFLFRNINLRGQLQLIVQDEKINFPDNLEISNPTTQNHYNELKTLFREYGQLVHDFQETYGPDSLKLEGVNSTVYDALPAMKITTETKTQHVLNQINEPKLDLLLERMIIEKLQSASLTEEQGKLLVDYLDILLQFSRKSTEIDSTENPDRQKLELILAPVTAREAEIYHKLEDKYREELRYFRDAINKSFLPNAKGNQLSFFNMRADRIRLEILRTEILNIMSTNVNSSIESLSYSMINIFITSDDESKKDLYYKIIGNYTVANFVLKNPDSVDAEKLIAKEEMFTLFSPRFLEAALKENFDRISKTTEKSKLALPNLLNYKKTLSDGKTITTSHDLKSLTQLFAEGLAYTDDITKFLNKVKNYEPAATLFFDKIDRTGINWPLKAELQLLIAKAAVGMAIAAAEKAEVTMGYEGKNLLACTNLDDMLEILENISTESAITPEWRNILKMHLYHSAVQSYFFTENHQDIKFSQINVTEYDFISFKPQKITALMAICKYSINSYISLNKNKKDTESSEFAERLSKISTAMEPNEIKIKALDALIKTTLSRTQTSLKDSSFKVILLLALFENPDTKKHFFNDDIAFANDLESDVRKYFFLIEHLKENIRSIFDPPKGTFSSITDLFRNRTESTLAPTSSLVLTPSGEDLHLEFTGFSWEEINKIIRIFDDAIERYRLGNPNKSPTDKGIINVANFETTLNKIYNANSSMQDKKSALEDLVKTALAVPQITLSDKSFKVILLLKLFSNPGTKAYFFNSTGEPPQFKSGIEKFSFLITQLKEEFQNESIQASSNRFSSFRKSLSIKISDTPAPASLGKSFDKKYSAAEFVSALLSVLQSIAGPIDIDPTRTLEHTFSSLNESDGFSTSVKTAEKLPTLLKKQEFLVDTIKTVLTDSDNSSKEKLLPLLFQNEMTKEFFFTDLRTLASRISSIPTSSPDKTATALGVYLDYLKPQFKPAAPLSEGNNPEFLMSS